MGKNDDRVGVTGMIDKGDHWAYCDSDRSQCGSSEGEGIRCELRLCNHDQSDGDGAGKEGRRTREIRSTSSLAE